jgi:hypothetical protein
MKTMRRRPLLATLLSALAAACSSETVAQPPPAPADWKSLEARPVVDAGLDTVTEKERALPVAYVTALATPGFAPLSPLLDDDAHFAFPGRDDAHGRSSVVHAHDVLFGAFDERKFATGRVWRTPNEQSVEWSLEGIQVRDWMGVAATHKAIHIQGLALLWTKDDGSITDIHIYFDVALVKAQLDSGLKAWVGAAPTPMNTGSPRVFEQTGTAEEKADVTTARASLDALENNDESGYVGAMADDLEVYTLERPVPLRGKADAKTYYKTMHRAVGQLDTTVEGAWGVGSFAVVEYSIAGEQLGPIGWIPTQRDNVVRLVLVDIDEIHDGKISRIWRYDNPSQIVAPTAR